MFYTSKQKGLSFPTLDFGHPLAEKVDFLALLVMP